MLRCSNASSVCINERLVGRASFAYSTGRDRGRQDGQRQPAKQSKDNVGGLKMASNYAHHNRSLKTTSMPTRYGEEVDSQMAGKNSCDNDRTMCCDVEERHTRKSGGTGRSMSEDKEIGRERGRFVRPARRGRMRRREEGEKIKHFDVERRRRRRRAKKREKTQVGSIKERE